MMQATKIVKLTPVVMNTSTKQLHWLPHPVQYLPTIGAKTQLKEMIALSLLCPAATAANVHQGSSVRNKMVIQQKRFVQTNAKASTVTSWISQLTSNTTYHDLSSITVHRSKRMLLDTLGVGILGHEEYITQAVAKTCLALEQVSLGPTINRSRGAVVWGSRCMKTNPATAAFINGCSVHSMDFDDTWHPATHPSSPVLPAVLALAESLPENKTISLQDLLVAYNAGIQVQGLLLRLANSAKHFPRRFHPPAVVGVMGSAAACSNLLGFGPEKCRNALGIAASFAGAPMANAGTTTKPLHAGKAARFGLEAALLADCGLEGNHNILDMASGFGAFYDDYDPEALLNEHQGNTEFLLHSQDIALKRFPAHMGMHWTIDAAMAVRFNLDVSSNPLNVEDVQELVIRAPKSKYINRPVPSTVHEARHSYQFNACIALLDGKVTPDSYREAKRSSPQLMTLLEKTSVETPEDNPPNLNEMYVEVQLHFKDGREVQGRCDTPYGHWRNPLSDADVFKKFINNTRSLTFQGRQAVIKAVTNMADDQPAADLAKLLHAK